LWHNSDYLISKTDAPRRGVERLMGSAPELMAKADETKPALGEATPIGLHALWKPRLTCAAPAR